MKLDSYNLKMIHRVCLFLVISILLIYSPVVGQVSTDSLKLHYTFSSQTDGVVPDMSGNTYHALLSGGATIGKYEGRDVLIINNTGTNFLDMNGGNASGKSAGKLIESLDTAYTISTFVYVDTITNLNLHGLPVYSFSNSLNQAMDANGCMFFEPKRGRHAISVNHYADEQGVNGGTFAKGRWVHIAYSQSGTKGILYYDGLPVAANNITVMPYQLGATVYNSIGRPCYSGDRWLVNTKINDFRIYNRSLSPAEINQLIEAAYPAELNMQYKALNLGDLSAVSTYIHLPVTMGSAGVIVNWASSDSTIISTDGNVNSCLKNGDASVKLSATLTYVQDGVTYTRIKEFEAFVPAISCDGSDIANWNFACENVSFINGEIKVKDISENAYIATLKNNCSLRTIGSTVKFQVLDLGLSNGYLDLGSEIGGSIYRLGDEFTISAYYYIDSSYSAISDRGNCLWVFSNNTSQGSTGNGAMFCTLSNQGEVLTSGGSDSEFGTKTNPAVPAPLGVWTHIAYVQDEDTGRMFVNGVEYHKAKCTLYPSEVLPIAGRMGTLYNTIGKPAYEGDSYLQKTLIYGFKINPFAKTSSDFLDKDVEGVPEILDALNFALLESKLIPDPIRAKLINERDNFRIDTSIPGIIKILNIKDDELVAIYDLIGYKIPVSNMHEVAVKPGVYIVKVGNKVIKVLVK